MEFTRATLHDLPELMALYSAATRHMDEQGIPQWDDLYPAESFVREDIDREQLYVGRIEGKIAVAFALEECREEDYEQADWRYREEIFVVLHRLCVHPQMQGQGVSRKAMDYLEQLVLSRGIRAIRLDAFPQNPAALHLYESRGYKKAGEIVYRKGLFYLYEKSLTSSANTVP
jgi:ribosomal protein S18 acetylase RimI-like enzyme